MKNKLFLSLTITALLLGACSDILDENPKAIASETFYNTPAEVEAALNSIYYPVGVSQLTNQVNMMEALADYGYAKGSLEFMGNYLGYSPANMSNMSLLWEAYYLMIRNANLVIANVPTGAETTEIQKSQFMAEAKFLRAFAYFHLVRLWGGVPLRTEENMKQIDLARSSVDDVYKLITDDIEGSLENLPDQPRILGTPSKLIAKTVLADVYLTRENWTKARDLSGEVINSGAFSLVPVQTVEDFQKLYGAELLTSTEEVYYVKYNRQYGLGFLNFLHHPGAPYKPYGANYFAFYTREEHPFYKNWPANDLRKQNIFYKWDIALGNDTYLYKKFIDPAGSIAAPNDWPLYRYADVLLMYAEADNRANNGPTAAAVEYLNRVKRRANGYDPLTPSPVDVAIGDFNEQTFFEAVFQERGYELFNEGKRWYDLLRTDKALEMVQQNFGVQMNPNMLLWPVPVGETSYNKLFGPNNPGY
jgi:starch-binding outer membrane protein, SusD/RagB family